MTTKNTKTKRAGTKTGKKKRAGTKTTKSKAPGKKKRAATKTTKDTAPAKKSSKTAKTVPRPPTPGISMVVSVFEPTKTHDARLRDVIELLGCTVTPENTAAQVAGRIAGASAPEVVIAGVPGAEAVVEAAAKRGRDRPVIVAALQGPADNAFERCRASGADLFVLRPHSRDSVAAVLQAAAALSGERHRLRAVQGTEDMLRERLQRYGQADAATGFQHFDFFKTLLVRELKRAKRYGYPLAACLIARDEVDAPMSPIAAQTLRTQAASAIAACIRDIDVPVDLDDERFLIFLPYTDLAGAEQVGKRVARTAQGFGVDGGPKLSLSIGIAATRPGKPISFARLMREATAAVRASQLKGGGRVVVRR